MGLVWVGCMVQWSVVFFFFFSSRRRHTRCREVSWARRCVQETGFNLAAVLPRRSTQCVCFGTAGVNTHNTQLTPFTAWTTRVSNPVCSPRFRVSASVIVQGVAFATDVPPDIYEFHLYTGNSTPLSETQAKQYQMHFLSQAEGFHI
eukprot:TRINITY_DN15819_c0_g1_i7.p1 TRINITY_DN15819_c0_g1~~TRINITY_DN15819_c0_g1_i7.p1  ORF type:complete len:147 (+),score=22.53 TRINITY_DN15819_c0_g1_i7:76-516(+)